MEKAEKLPKQKKVSYAKWGYIFIASFFIIYAIFTLIPQVVTIIDSFYDYTINTTFVERGDFCGFDNYVAIASNDRFTGKNALIDDFTNTFVMWIIGAVPQLVVALLLALIFTSERLKLKGMSFFKTLFYMPNLIMASAFSALFLILFGRSGILFNMLLEANVIGVNFDFIANGDTARILVAFMNFLMWFGNTMILLMAGIQSIDESIFESARIDGANSRRVLFDITLPLLKPICVYVFITSMIGGLQMYDVPQVLTAKAKNNDTETLVMLVGKYLGQNNYGYAGAVSVVLFIITGILSFIVFKFINKKED